MGFYQVIPYFSLVFIVACGQPVTKESVKCFHDYGESMRKSCRIIEESSISKTRNQLIDKYGQPFKEVTFRFNEEEKTDNYPDYDDIREEVIRRNLNKISLNSKVKEIEWVDDCQGVLFVYLINEKGIWKSFDASVYISLDK